MRRRDERRAVALRCNSTNVQVQLVVRFSDKIEGKSVKVKQADVEKCGV